MFELSLAESVQEIPQEIWADLRGPEAFPFLRRRWISAFETSACVGLSQGWIPRHLVIRKGSETVAVAPAYIKLHSYGEFVFDQGWAEFSEGRLGLPYYPKLVLGVPFTPTTGPRILLRRSLDEQDRGLVYDLLTGALPELAEKLGLSSAHILFPDEHSSQQLRQRGWVERLGVQFQFKNPGYADFDDFLSSFRAKKRASIRRECRALQEQEVQISTVSGEQFGAEDATLAHRLYLTTVDKHIWGRRYLKKAFFEEVVRTMPDALHFVVARDKAGDVLGGAFNLVGQEALYGRYWGAFSETPFLHFNVCLYEGVRECLRLGLSRFEPGAGGGHKEGRGFAPSITRSFHYLREPSLDLAVRDFCKREADAVSEHVLSCRE